MAAGAVAGQASRTLAPGVSGTAGRACVYHWAITACAALAWLTPASLVERVADAETEVAPM